MDIGDHYLIDVKFVLIDRLKNKKAGFSPLSQRKAFNCALCIENDRGLRLGRFIIV